MAWLGLPALRALAGGPRLTGELARILGIPQDQAKRVCRCLRARGLVRTREGIHELTAQGRQAVARGEEITCGPDKGQVRRDGSLRARAWRAMRIKEKFGLDELLTLLCDGTERQAENNLQGYLRILERAGYLVELKRRGPEGSRRWWLARDTGPQAPAWNKVARTLADPNTGELHDVSARQKKGGEGLKTADRRRFQRRAADATCRNASIRNDKSADASAVLKGHGT